MKKPHLAFMALIASLSLTGCGSLSTLGKPDGVIASDLSRHHSNCKSMPRIYSGVSYDICRMNSRYQSMSHDVFGTFILAFFIVDLLPSAVVDTLALPYSGYQQHRYGDIVMDVN
jgi:uncharacterized protein YceK